MRAEVGPPDHVLGRNPDMDEKGPGEDAPQADHVRFHFDPGATLAVLVGHRRRFGSPVADLTAEELAAPSRCEEWTVADVLRHGLWVDGAMRLLSEGESPVESFDPRITPNELVQADRAVPDEEIRQRYLSSTEAVIADLEQVDPERWGRPSLSPLGPVPWWLMVVHVGWDSTIHERDALVPLGRAVEAPPDELMPCLAYSLVLTSFFEPDPLHVQIGPVRMRSGDGPVTASSWTAGAADPSDEAATVLTGEPAAIIDALSGRRPLTGVLGGDRSVIERLGGLARYFGPGG